MGLFKRLAVFVVTGMTLVLVSPQLATAQEATDDASIILAALEEGASDAKIQELVNAALGRYPDGGADLAALISKLVVASPNLADAFLKAAASATPAQKSSVGAGLGQAVSIINEKDPEAATAIAQLVAATDDKVIQVAFVASVGDGTAAIAGVAGGGGGGATGGTQAGTLSVGSSGGGSGGGSVSPSS